MMSDRIDLQNNPAVAFEDELSDESLDRTKDGNVPFCCAFCTGDKGWLQPAPTRDKP
jgi:hypothetical protein